MLRSLEFTPAEDILADAYASPPCVSSRITPPEGKVQSIRLPEDGGACSTDNDESSRSSSDYGDVADGTECGAEERSSVSILTSLGAPCPEVDVPPATRFERAIGMRIRAPIIGTAEASEAIWGSAVDTKARVLALEASQHGNCGAIRQACCTQARKHAPACDDASSGAVELDDLRRGPRTHLGPAFTMVPPPTLLERAIGMRVRIGGTASDAEAAWLANDKVTAT